ncbi:MAG: hypothetical protein M1815_006241 [Lichina confinis]|nr:MAG: hypothetical protein M1815_006241 [Lichina confinis]
MSPSPFLRFGGFSRGMHSRLLFFRRKPINSWRQRRWQSSEGATARGQNVWERLWHSPWALVIAGISDFYRPAEKLSLTQNIALLATGSIWTRWCLIIKPKNVLLAAVNFFLAGVGVVQVSRILAYRRSVANSDTGVKAAAEEVVGDVKEVAHEAKDAAKDAAKKLV